MSPTTSTVDTEAAEIVCDKVGRGPLLLTIAGGGGAGNCYTEMAALLADAYTVVTYDRRRRGRSTGDATLDLDMAQQARDAVAVIRAAGAERALVFGNSGGANIGLKLVEDHPESVRALIVHEPPIMAAMPHAEEELKVSLAIHDTFQRQGLLPALMQFMKGLVGFEGGLPTVGQGPNPADMQFFMAHEFLPISTYKPDLDRLRRSRVPIVALAGTLSADAYYARTARHLAATLPCPYHQVPGHHMAFMSDPAPFAAALRPILDGFRG